MLKANLEKISSEKGIIDVLENAVVPLPEDTPDVTEACSPTPPIMRALKQAIDKSTSDEARKNYQQLLDTASQPMTPEARRPILAILLAEQFDTTESRKLIADVAAGPPGAYETKVAQAALVRMRLKDEANK